MARWLDLRKKNRQGGVAIRTEYGGRYYASRRESEHAARLDNLMSAQDPRHRVVSWRPQENVPLIVNGQHITTYRVDFWVMYADGREEWHEVKGAEEEVWLLKRKLFEALFPDRILKVFR